jgi:hypothetical protein
VEDAYSVTGGNLEAFLDFKVGLRNKIVGASEGVTGAEEVLEDLL